MIEVYNAMVDCRNEGIVRKVHAPKDPVVGPVHDIDGTRVRRSGVIDLCNHGSLLIAGDQHAGFCARESVGKRGSRMMTAVKAVAGLRQLHARAIEVRQDRKSS